MMTLIKQLSFATALGMVSVSSYAASSSTARPFPKGPPPRQRPKGLSPPSIRIPKSTTMRTPRRTRQSIHAFKAMIQAVRAV